MPGTKRIPHFVLLFCALPFFDPARAQKPQDLVLPGPRHGGQATQSTAPSAASACDFDPVFRYGYGNRRETAVAALLAGDDFENVTHSRERALGMFMLSIQRDPLYVPALFNLGVMSARGGRWDDALKFYQETRRLDTSHQFGDMIEAEVTRVDMIARFESTPDGQRQRRFNMQLDDVTARYGDPAIALDRAAKLIKADPGRWEAPAAAGTMQAILGQYDDSAKSLDTAARLAPPAWRMKLNAAADLARQEGQYLHLSQDADAAMEKKQYANAAKLYADAWQASPARLQTGMQAAVAFLMADEVSLAVQTLSRLRQTGSPEIIAKATRMLNELGAISPDAKMAATQPRSGEAEPVVDVGERVRSTLGELRSPEMRISTAPDPALLSDSMKFIHVNDDQINIPQVFVSSQSLFSMYQQRSCGPPGQNGPAPQLAVPDNSATGPVPPAAVQGASPETAAPAPPVVPAVRPRLPDRPSPL